MSATDGRTEAGGWGGAGASGQDPKPSQPALQDPRSAKQDPKDDAQAKAAAKKLVEAMKSTFDEHGIIVDTDAGTVTIPAVMNSPRDPIEYLLIHRKGKMHEAMMFTKSQPSVINTALLLLGFEKGKNASYREKDPMPTLEELEAGVDPIIITPPSGRQYWMTVRFKDADGQKVEYAVEDLIYDLRGDGPLGKAAWYYIGGRMASLYKDEPEVYIADFEGNLVSVCYLLPDNHLGTIKHERARDDQNWWLTDKCPMPETEIEFVFHKNKPKLVAAREKRLEAEGAPKEQPQSEVPEGRNGGR